MISNGEKNDLRCDNRGMFMNSRCSASGKQDSARNQSGVLVNFETVNRLFGIF